MTKTTKTKTGSRKAKKGSAPLPPLKVRLSDLRAATEDVRFLIHNASPDIAKAIERRLYVSPEGLDPEKARENAVLNTDTHEQVVEKLRDLSIAYANRAKEYEAAVRAVLADAPLRKSVRGQRGGGDRE